MAQVDPNMSPVLKMLQAKYPDYHPLMAVAEMAHQDGTDAKTKLQCHMFLGPYVAPTLKSVEFKGSMKSDFGQLSVTLYGHENDAPVGKIHGTLTQTFPAELPQPE